MRLDEGRVALLSAAIAIAGILILLLLSEAPQRQSAAYALVAQENTLVILNGIAHNCTAERFSLCDTICISVRGSWLPAFQLVGEGRQVEAEGRVKEYKGRRYLEASRIEVR